MKLVVWKNYLRGQILYRSLDLIKILPLGFRQGRLRQPGLDQLWHLADIANKGRKRRLGCTPVMFQLTSFLNFRVSGPKKFGSEKWKFRIFFTKIAIFYEWHFMNWNDIDAVFWTDGTFLQEKSQKMFFLMASFISF